MQTLLLGIVFITIAAIFLGRYNTLFNDADAGPANMTPNQWWRLTAVELSFNLILFIAVCFGLNISLIVQLANFGSDTATQANITTIAGAIATGTLIQQAVQRVIIPLFNKITGATTARKALREKVKAETKSLTETFK